MWSTFPTKRCLIVSVFILEKCTILIATVCMVNKRKRT